MEEVDNRFLGKMQKHAEKGLFYYRGIHHYSYELTYYYQINDKTT